MEDQRKAKNPIKSTKVTFEIVEMLKELDGAQLKDIADELGRSKSSVHNYLSTLQEMDYVVKDGMTYRVGLRFLELGSYARHKQQIYDTAKPHVKELAEETGDLVNLLVEEHGRGIYLYREKGEKSVNVDAYTGHRVYLHNTALGKALLAEMPRARVDEIIDRHGLPATTDRTVTDREELYSELEAVRERGVAFDREERLKGLRCLAMAVTDNQGRARGAISISGPTNRMQGDRYETELPQKLESIVNVIGLNITYS